MKSAEAGEWKEAMQRKHDALLENGTWKLVDRPTDQHVLTATGSKLSSSIYIKVNGVAGDPKKK